MTNLNLSVLTTKQDRTDYLFEPASHTQRGGAFDLHKLIGKLPTPKSGWTLPNHKYCGPYNPLEDQLDEDGNPLPNQKPYNQVDAICLEHDKDYDKATSKADKHQADKRCYNRLAKLNLKTFVRELIKQLQEHSLVLNISSDWALTDDQKQTLDDIYYNTKTGYSSINELQRRSGLKKRCERLPSTSRNVHKT